MRKRIQNVSISVLLLLSLLAFTPGCKSSRLETGGAYAPTEETSDPAFYAVDSAYALAFASVNAAFEIERNNRLFLWNLSPEIKHTLDRIRPKAVEADKDYIQLREDYKKLPSGNKLDALRLILAKVQEFATESQGALPNTGVPTQ